MALEKLAILSLVLTLLSSMPSGVILAKHPTIKYFKIALFNISMAFFFFSYHVHEKTILVPLLPLLINPRFFRHFYLDFIIFSTSTCYDLLKEDKLEIQFFIFTTFYLIFGSQLMKFLISFWDKNDIKSAIKINNNESKLDKLLRVYVSIYKRYISKLLYLLLISVMIIEAFLAPPKRFPFLYELFYAILGFIQFFIVFGYSNLKLFAIARRDSISDEKMNKNLSKELLGKKE